MSIKISVAVMIMRVSGPVTSHHETHTGPGPQASYRLLEQGGWSPRKKFKS